MMRRARQAIFSSMVVMMGVAPVVHAIPFDQKNAKLYEFKHEHTLDKKYTVEKEGKDGWKSESLQFGGFLSKNNGQHWTPLFSGGVGSLSVPRLSDGIVPASVPSIPEPATLLLVGTGLSM